MLFVDVDGVISLFGFADGERPPGALPLDRRDRALHSCREAGKRLARLAERYELVWATGWEETANEYLPFLLEPPRDELPCLSFDGRAVFGRRTGSSTRSTSTPATARRPGSTTTSTRRATPGPPDASAPTLLVSDRSRRRVSPKSTGQTADCWRLGRRSRPEPGRRSGRAATSSLVRRGAGRRAPRRSRRVRRRRRRRSRSPRARPRVGQAQLGRELGLVEQADLLRRRALRPAPSARSRAGGSA